MENNYKINNFKYSHSNNINVYEVIINSLILLLVLTVFAFNNQKMILYPLKVVYILIMGFLFLLRNKHFNMHITWSIVFLTWCLATILWSSNVGNALYDFLWVFQAFLILMFTTPYIDTEKKIEFLVKCIIAGSLLLVIRLLITTPPSYWGNYRIGFTSGYNPNTVGMEMVIATLCTTYFIKKKKRIILYLLLGSLFILILLLTGSRKSFLALIIGLLIFYFLGTRIKKVIITIPLFSIFLYFVYYAVMDIPFFYNIIGDRLVMLIQTFQGNTENVRVDMIQTGLQLFSERPLLGYGIGAYETVSGFGTYSHNNYIEMLVNLGIIGLLIYYSLYVYIIYKLLILYKNTKNNLSLLFLTMMIVLIFLEIGVVSYRNISLLLIVSASYAYVLYFNKLSPPKKS